MSQLGNLHKLSIIKHHNIIQLTKDFYLGSLLLYILSRNQEEEEEFKEHILDKVQKWHKSRNKKTCKKEKNKNVKCIRRVVCVRYQITFYPHPCRLYAHAVEVCIQQHMSSKPWGTGASVGGGWGKRGICLLKSFSEHCFSVYLSPSSTHANCVPSPQSAVTQNSYSTHSLLITFKSCLQLFTMAPFQLYLK